MCTYYIHRGLPCILPIWTVRPTSVEPFTITTDVYCTSSTIPQCPIQLCTKHSLSLTCHVQLCTCYPLWPIPWAVWCNSIAVESVDKWCHKFNLGNDECQSLIKLGFKVGDKLDLVTDDMWEWVGVAPLHHMHILAAYQVGQ